MTLHDLLIHEMCDMYDAEQQLLEALPLMMEATSTSELKASFKEHLKQTKEHVKRLERAAKSIDLEIKAVPCDGMKGIIKEGSKLLKEEPSLTLDAALIGAAQRVEHYEIAAYGTIISLAKQMKHRDVVDELEMTLDEEEETDKLLTKLAKSKVNKEAPTGMED